LVQTWKIVSVYVLWVLVPCNGSLNKHK
jgi:hypothetical protein